MAFLGVELASNDKGADGGGGAAGRGSSESDVVTGGGAKSAPRAVGEREDPYVRHAKSRLGRVVRRKWRLDALLGVGGMAAVYAATHRNASRVAIKMLHPQLATEEHKRRFLNEGYLANKVGHPGVVRVLDDDEAEDGSIFLVMELLEGESLESYVNRRIRLPEDEALAIAEKVLETLVAAHTAGIVHRDVKPENIFLCRTGLVGPGSEVKLLDFGIARLRELSQGSNATRHGFLLGTPMYMAPEQANGDWDQVDGRTDVWSVGASLFKMLTGRTVHEGGTHVEVLMKAGKERAPRLRRVAPELDELVCALIDRALAFEKADRWSSAQEMLEALRSVCGAIGAEERDPLRERVAQDATIRFELPELSEGSEEFDRALALESDPLGIDDDDPTVVGSAVSDRERVRQLLMLGPPDSVEVDVGDFEEPGQQTGIRGRRSLPSIFDDVEERSTRGARERAAYEPSKSGPRQIPPVAAPTPESLTPAGSLPPLAPTLISPRPAPPAAPHRALRRGLAWAALALTASALALLVGWWAWS